MRLQRLTGLEIDILREEYEELIKAMNDLKDILCKRVPYTADYQRRAGTDP